ncbi:MAG: V-type ATPase subunit [Treponema sp.]|jgi:vacuolar-type H+-ATPase subunit C/Vma6|nr:V-type ATPase subunit [Treponema sp.]
MDRSDASIFVYAKASGMLAKSFIGQRAAKLFSVGSFGELWSLLFRSEVPGIPAELLAKKLEQEAEKRFISQYVSLLKNYTKPDSVLVSLLRYYDFDNLKGLGAALCRKQSSLPYITDIAPYSMLHYDAWPELDRITAGTPLAWYDTPPKSEEQQKADARLDNQYITMLFDSIEELPSEEREPVLRLLKLRFVFQNILWAIRLKVYYNMDKKDIISHLAHTGGQLSVNNEIAAPAVQILDKAVDSWNDWASWKYAYMLNPREDNALWTIDPRWLELSMRKELNRQALMKFHSYPFTAMVMVTWYMIKENELNTICTAAETLRLDADKNQAMQFAGVSPDAAR